MKKKIYTGGVIVFISLTIYLLTPLLSINKFPSVEYLNLRNEKVDISKINLNNKKTILFYINPNCDACNKIIKIIKTTDRKIYKIIVISSYYNYVNYNLYKNKFNLQKQDNFLIDSGNTFTHDFNIGISYSMPIILKFDKYGHRIKTR